MINVVILEEESLEIILLSDNLRLTVDTDHSIRIRIRLTNINSHCQVMKFKKIPIILKNMSLNTIMENKNKNEMSFAR